MRLLSIAVLVFLALALSGCYTYGALETPKPDPGNQLRLTLTFTGSDSLARWLGPNVATVDGRLIQETPTVFEIGVSNVTMHSGMEQYWKGESVTLPKPLVASVEVRKFSWGKTGLLAGLVVVTIAALQGSGAIQGGLFGSGGGKPQ